MSGDARLGRHRICHRLWREVRRNGIFLESFMPLTRDKAYEDRVAQTVLSAVCGFSSPN